MPSDSYPVNKGFGYVRSIRLFLANRRHGQRGARKLLCDHLVEFESFLTTLNGSRLLNSISDFLITDFEFTQDRSRVVPCRQPRHEFLKAIDAPRSLHEVGVIQNEVHAVLERRRGLTKLSGVQYIMASLRSPWEPEFLELLRRFDFLFRKPHFHTQMLSVVSSGLKQCFLALTSHNRIGITIEKP